VTISAPVWHLVSWRSVEEHPPSPLTPPPPSHVGRSATSVEPQFPPRCPMVGGTCTVHPGSSRTFCSGQLFCPACVCPIFLRIATPTHARLNSVSRIRCSNDTNNFVAFTIQIALLASIVCLKTPTT